jgi:hypothetical protein
VKACILVLLLALVVPRTARADDATEARARQVLIVLRVLAYDRALATRAPGDRVGVMIVHDSSQASRADAALWRDALGLFPKVKVGGRHLRTVTTELAGEAAFDTLLAQQRPALVIIAGVGDVAKVRRLTRKHRALSFSANEADVRAGIAFGIVPTEDGHQIVVNREGAIAEGAKLGAGLLQLARLVEAR